ncbi:MAG: hypothetical protein ABIQ53_15495 [Terracoccus sp.]
MSDDGPGSSGGPVPKGEGMPPRQVRVSGAGAMAVAFGGLLLGLATVAGCSSDPPVELNQTRPPVTVTVTTTVTAPVTSTSATSSATTGGSSTSSLPAGSSSPPPASASGTTTSGGPGGAAQSQLVSQYQAMVAKIGVIDALPRTGTAAGSALDDLAGRYRALRASPVPAKVDRPSYVGRLFSLELFAAAAAEEARASSPQATARYDVIRAQTATLLVLVNSGLGTSLALPAPGAPRPTM